MEPTAQTTTQTTTVSPPTAAPTTASQVTPHLNQTQQVALAVETEMNNPLFEGTKTREQIEGEIRAQLLPTSPIPTAPKMEETYGKLREEYGLTDIESNINELKTSRRALEAQTRQRVQNEEGQTVALNVISGRITETERQAREDLDFLDRQIQYQTEQVQTGYKIIDTVMTLKGMDYEASLKAYETEFNQNKAMYTALNEELRDQRDFKQRMVERAEDNAKANLQTYANLIMKGNMRYKDLTQGQKLEISKLEIQSGLGLGYLSKLSVSPQDRIVSTSGRIDPSGNKYVDTILRNDAGKMVVKSILVGREYVPSMYSGSRSSSSANSKAAGAAAKAAADRQEAFWKAADDSKGALRDDASWGEVWNSFKVKFPEATPQAIDAALGVPGDWIKQGKPGYEWWATNR